jgi:hypothetical protein
MRILYITAFLLIGFCGYGQIGKGSYKKIALVIALVDTGKCEYAALKVIGDTVMIDTCFDKQTNLFTIDKVQSINDNTLFRQIQNLTGITLEKMQKSLDSVRNCDYAMPFIIQLTDDKNKLETFSLKRFANCYPTSAKQLMETLENYFQKDQ